MAWNSLIPFLVIIGSGFDSDPFALSSVALYGRDRSQMGRMLGGSDGMEHFDPVPCDNRVEFDSDPFANPHLNPDSGTNIAFPDEMFGLEWRR